MAPVHYTTKRSFWLFRAAGGVGMAALSATFMRAGFGSAGGWFGLLGTVFFGLAAIVGIIQGTRRGPRITIDDDGVNDRSLGVGVIAWSDITRAEPYGVAQQPFIGLHLRDPARYLARASPFKRMLARVNAGAGAPLSVNLAGVDADPTEVVQLIMSRRGDRGVTGNDVSVPSMDDEPNATDVDDSDDPSIHDADIDIDDDEEVDADPPDARRVAQRALVFAAVTRRAALEDEAGDPAADALRRDMLAWLDEAGALPEAERAERRLLEARIGTLDERRIIDATWRGEALAVLAWALGRADLLSYQEMVSLPRIADALGFMRPAGRTLIDTASLRGQAELETMAARLFALHWRLREFTLRRQPMDFAVFARTARFGPLDITGLELADGDLAIDGQPIAAVSEDRIRECMSIARERQQAANWLCGGERLYSNASSDT